MKRHPLTQYRADNELTLEGLAERLGVKAPIVSKYETGRHKIPAERAVQIERRLGISRSDLRPDLWPHEQALGAAP